MDSELQVLAERIGRGVAEELATQLRQSGTPIIPEYVSPEAAATLTGFTPKALERLRHRRQGCPFIRVGRSIRYRVADLRTWMESGSQP